MSQELQHDPETGEIWEENQQETRPNIGEYSVSEISHKLKRTLEETFSHVRVRGEISGYRGAHSSGHAYFTIKDEGARLDAVVWRGVFTKLKLHLQEGLEVIATGKITSYPGKSNYQIVIENIEAAGIGALMALLEQRKQKLAAEGLFAPERKRPLPFLPRKIGVITSPTGAVIRDILHRLAERFPRPVIVWPVRVQGGTSAAEVVAAIQGFNALDNPPDLLIVARGGGSLEDLWGFNDEAVVRAVAASKIPVISAVGHETDTTLIDLVADLRAPTPTAAAERAVPVRAELLARLATLEARQARGLARYYEERRTKLRSAARGLPQPDDLLGLLRQRLDSVGRRLPASLRSNLSHHRLGLAGFANQLTGNRLKQHTAALRDKLNKLEQRTKSIARVFTVAQSTLERLDGQLKRASLLNQQRIHQHYQFVSQRLKPAQAQQALAPLAQRLQGLEKRHDLAQSQLLHRLKGKLEAGGKLLAALSYESILTRGYAVIRNSADKPLARAGDVRPGQSLKIQFADGTIPALANRKPNQGELF